LQHAPCRRGVGQGQGLVLVRVVPPSVHFCFIVYYLVIKLC
jgi:hypothetical protein